MLSLGVVVVGDVVVGDVVIGDVVFGVVDDDDVGGSVREAFGGELKRMGNATELKKNGNRTEVDRSRRERVLVARLFLDGRCCR